ncbi:type II toxin-antitoxin system HipA family toxin [Marinobacterium sp. xm-d-564]|uniref:type II toxin-antitoxin system HipA family toxin n=1 Tax=Marinobacterium sp. xm-d-564 TaxID=2497742 RepID=UPI001A027EE7|nr:HipA domain-containing protein [Marinobacterium sp. xm-d-564]NRP59908.1 putative DNA-binding transcriptional regulator [Marinobacterium sp. xm-d-564]
MQLIEQIYAHMKLNIEIFTNSTWQNAATLEILEPQKGRLSPCKLEYNQDYAMAHLFSRAEHACSLNLPVELMLPYRSNQWFGFMDDIVPSGSSRRYWVDFLSLGNLPQGEQDTALLANGCIAPVGNLRIRESVPKKRNASTLRRFSIEDIADRQNDFLDYALEMGAVSGGATGAAGEAPKVLVRLTEDNQVWIDTWQDDSSNTDQHYLVKFPRGKKTHIDCELLRAEYHYYCELAALGFSTVQISQLKLIEGERYPSLWLPRFDVSYSQDTIHHLGLESIYSVLSAAPGSHLNHFDVIQKLSKALAQDDPTFSKQALVEEWLQRDLLNIIFANSDNHGRNTSLLKQAGKITLAPIYDFAPMKADPEGIVRTTRWGNNYERGGEVDWQAIIQNLPTDIDKDRCLTSLRHTADKLLGLKERLLQRVVSEDLLSIPALGMNTIEERLTRWGLL